MKKLSTLVTLFIFLFVGIYGVCMQGKIAAISQYIKVTAANVTSEQSAPPLEDSLANQPPAPIEIEPENLLNMSGKIVSLAAAQQALLPVIVAPAPINKPVDKGTPKKPQPQKTKKPDKPLNTKTPKKGKVADKSRMVALTFDDGPHSKLTPKLLKILKKYDARATFFVIGKRAQDNKKIIKKMKEQGCEVGSHTYNHNNLTKLSPKQIKDNLSKTSKAAGVKLRLVRPPFGAADGYVQSAIGAPIILWSIDTLDWKYKNPKSVFTRATSNVKNGDIILMHDIHSTTIDAAEKIIKELTAKGYKLVTVSELLKAKGYKVQDGAVYFKAK